MGTSRSFVSLECDNRRQSQGKRTNRHIARTRPSLRSSPHACGKADMEAIFAPSGDLPFEGEWDGQPRPTGWL